MKKHYDNQLLINIKSYIQSGILDVAEEKINDYKILYPEDNVINKYYAKLLLKKGFYEESKNVCLEALNGYFHDKRLKSDMYIALAESYVALDEIDNAIDSLEKSYELKESNTQAIQVKLATLYMMKNDKDKAMQILDKNENNAFNKIADLQKAIIYFNESKYDIALKLLLDINDEDLKNKRDVQLKNLYIGNIYKIYKDLDRASMYYSKVLRTKNELYYYAYYGIGYINYKKGYVDEAIKILEETIKKYCTNTVLEALVRCYLFKGDVDKCYRLINKIDIDDIRNVYLGRLELIKQNYLEAEILLTNVINNYSFKIDKYLTYANYYLIITKFRQKKYEETLVLINNLNNIKRLSDNYKRDIKLLKFYINNILGKAVFPSRYSEKQVISYSKKNAIKHIVDHHFNDNNKSTFNDEKEIEEIYDYVRDNINSSQKLISGFLDRYIIDFPKDIGTDNNRKLRSVTVVCIPDTDNILTMYPYRYEQILDDSLIENSNKIKVKRLSQIEKFNKKYNL